MVGTMSVQSAVHELEARRLELVDELLAIRSLVRGSLTEQYQEVPRQGAAKPVWRGPYYVLSRSQEGRT